MTPELNKLVEELEKELWTGYTETVMDHAQNPRNMGSIAAAIGAVSGAALVAKFSSSTLKTLFGILFFYVSLKYILNFWGINI